ncbi:polysaccharide deacetylase family protein [Arthrobacter sp. Sa2CUA1]|uniref:Polysaccharide deacetylase family protein n=1 Tax=Arthrobacter gallicola TaxID=2762225 RepID=A0ABR8UN41_9MICC|nr:polysaccharide deacetylase family protein [Arthrobacter gallicola]
MPKVTPSSASSPSRRTALAALGAAAVLGAAACARGAAEPAHTSPPVSRSPLPSNSPSASKPPQAQATGAPSASAPEPSPSPPARPVFVPDYVLPPVTNGLAPVITRIPTSHPVVFLTIDDGAHRTPEMVALMAEYGYLASIFLSQTFVQADPAYFDQFLAQGSLIENHTLSHNINMVRQLGYSQQLAEISGMQDFAQQHYGRLPTLFRPPGGAYSPAMQQAVAAAGLRAIVTWEAKANAGGMDYQVGSALRPGDIVLMHFRPEFAADLNAFRQAHLAAGLEVVLLEDFLAV